MSLYNAVFGESSDADVLLGVLGLTPESFYRYRDCYLSNAGEIAVYTRGGGGNRGWEEEDAYASALNHPNFVRDADDEFDSTYCTLYFSVPEDAKARLEGMCPKESRNERWLKFIEALKK